MTTLCEAESLTRAPFLLTPSCRYFPRHFWRRLHSPLVHCRRWRRLHSCCLIDRNGLWSSRSLEIRWYSQIGRGLCCWDSGWSRRWRQSQLLSHLSIKLDQRVFVFFEEGARVFAALSDAFSLVAVPRARLFHDVVNRRNVEQIAFFRDPLPVHYVELGFAEGGGHFVFYDFDFGA